MRSSPKHCSPPRCPPAGRTAVRPIRSARFPARKTVEEFDFNFQRSVKKTVVEHLVQLDFLHARENVILLGPPVPARHIWRSSLASAPAWPGVPRSSSPYRMGLATRGSATPGPA